MQNVLVILFALALVAAWLGIQWLFVALGGVALAVFGALSKPARAPAPASGGKKNASAPAVVMAGPNPGQIAYETFVGNVMAANNPSNPVNQKLDAMGQRLEQIEKRIDKAD
jgi:hypothetical protein